MTEPAGGSSGKGSSSSVITEKNKPTETEVDPVDEGPSRVPGPSCSNKESQIKTELSRLEMYIPHDPGKLRNRLEECSLDWTPVTEVWPNIYIGNEETALDRAMLKTMGITHILKAAATEEDLHGNITPRDEHYQGMDMTYYYVPALDEDMFDISEYFFPAAEFINKALSNPENKVLIHCFQGVSRSATLFLAYLMIQHDIMVENAIDHVTGVRWIRPNMGFLKQLTALNLTLVEKRKLQLREQLKKDNEDTEKPVPELQESKKHIDETVIHLKHCLQKCTLDQRPVTEVWPNVVIGDEHTAMDRAKLKQMGITHILNAAAVKNNLMASLGMPRKEDLLRKVKTGAKYYKGMNITYYGVPVVDDHCFDISKYFYPSAAFIHQALSNPENKVLVHCTDGVSRSPTLFLAYLMIHYKMPVEYAIDRVLKVRCIWPNLGFLKQLAVLNSKLACHNNLFRQT
ncbi:uncharacterized protein si:ch211-121a2.2 [Danio aesculapii]|uniref:uncharacterized protein si:ch211-121a2.2 n=1 Tax=Danio aesculapii TaxID=1142201 RepID=UPI0024BF4782|nr:uncharacterized protein si:ch211-121a2.2 [Danio aesculapii]